MTASVAAPLLTLSLTGSAVFAGWVAAAGTLPCVLLQMPAGLLVDRMRHRRRLMRACQVVRLLSCLVFLLGLSFSESPQFFLLAAVAVDATCATVYNLAEITTIRNLVPRESRSSAAAKDEVRGHISQMAGRSLGGYLFGLNQTFPYLFDAATSVAALAALRFTGEDDRADEPRTPPGRTPNRTARTSASGWRTIWQDAYLRRVIAVCAAANLLLQVTILLLLVRAREENYSSTRIGLLLAVSGLFGVIGSIVTEKWLTPTEEHVPGRTSLCFWLWVLFMAGVWWSPSPAYGLVFWGMFSTVGAYLNIVLRCHQTNHVPEELLGRVSGICKFITGGAVPLGALIAGYVVDRWESREIMPVLTCLLAAVVLLAERPWRGLRWPLGVEELRPVPIAGGDRNRSKSPRHLRQRSLHHE